MTVGPRVRSLTAARQALAIVRDNERLKREGKPYLDDDRLIGMLSDDICEAMFPDDVDTAAQR